MDREDSAMQAPETRGGGTGARRVGPDVRGGRDVLARLGQAPAAVARTWLSWFAVASWREVTEPGPRRTGAILVVVAGLSALVSLWTSGAVRRIDLGPLAPGGPAPGGPAPSVSALGWEDRLRIGTAGQGVGTWMEFDPTSAAWRSRLVPEAERGGETVLAFPGLNGAPNALSPVLVLSRPLLPGAETGLFGDGPGTFAREGRAVVFKSAGVRDGLVLPRGTAALANRGNSLLVDRLGVGGRYQLATEPLKDPGQFRPVGPLIETPVSAVVVENDGSAFALGDVEGGVAVFEAGQGDEAALAGIDGGGFTRLRNVFRLPNETGVLQGPEILQMAMAGSGDNRVIIAAASDGRVAVLRPAVPSATESGIVNTTFPLESFRIGLPPLGFNLVELLPPQDAALATPAETPAGPMSISSDGRTAAVWSGERNAFLLFDTFTGAFLGTTAVVDRLTDSGLDQDIGALAKMAADAKAASISVGGDSIPTPLSGAAVSEAGKAMIWGAESGVTFTRPLTQDPSGATAPGYVPDEAFAGSELAFPRGGTDFAALSTLTGFYRPGEDRLVLLGSQGDVLELSPSGDVLAQGQYPAPGADLAATEISFPTPTVDVVLWTPTGEGAPAMIGRYDRRTRSLLRMVQTQSVDDDSRLAERADLMVSLDASGSLDIADTRNGEIVGRITPEGEGFLTPAPSAEGQILAFYQTGRRLLVIHRSQAPPPRDPQVSAEGLRVQPDLIRPLPVVAQGGLQLSADGQVLLLRSRDGQLFTGGTDPAKAPDFLRDNDDPLQACCLHLRPLAPEARFIDAVLSPDGQVILALRTDNLLLALPRDPAQAALALLHLPGPVTALDLSPDGSRLAIGLGTQGVRILDLGRVSLLARLSHLPFATAPAPEARPGLALPPPSKPWGDIALLGAFGSVDEALAARPDGTGRAFSILELEGGGTLLVESVPGPATALSRASALARVRADVPQATLHWLSELCPGAAEPAPRIRCAPASNRLTLERN